LPKIKYIKCDVCGNIHYFGDSNSCCPKKHKPIAVYSRALGIAFKLPKRKEK